MQNETFDDFLEKEIKKLNLFISVGKYVCQVHFVHELTEGLALFGRWNNGLLTGVDMSAADYHSLRADGEVVAQTHVDTIRTGKPQRICPLTVRWEFLKQLPITDTAIFSERQNLINK